MDYVGRCVIELLHVQHARPSRPLAPVQRAPRSLSPSLPPPPNGVCAFQYLLAARTTARRPETKTKREYADGGDALGADRRTEWERTKMRTAEPRRAKQ